MIKTPRGLPDYTRQVEVIVPELEAPGLYMAINIGQKTANALTTQYLKDQCILPNYTTIASSIGMMVSYEGGYISRALIFKAGAGEVALAKNILDVWAAHQKSDGSWSQQYYPYLNAAGLHDEYENRQVDSGAGLLAWAMAEYDKAIGVGSVIYKTYVQLAFNFLEDAQTAHFNAHGTKFLANQRLNNTWNTTALAADCGEVLLAAAAVLDQYGSTTTNQRGTSIATIMNKLYTAIGAYLYAGDAVRYYLTAYPATATVWGLDVIKTQLSFTQALCAWAIKNWAGKAYRTGIDYSAQAERVLDKSVALCMGKWGGIMYRPFDNTATEKRDEYTNYAAIMAQALNAVNSTKYANQISRLKYFIQLAALSRGEVHDYIPPSGRMDIAVNAHYGFLSLNASNGLLAGA